MRRLLAMVLMGGGAPKVSSSEERGLEGEARTLILVETFEVADFMSLLHGLPQMPPSLLAHFARDWGSRYAGLPVPKLGSFWGNWGKVVTL